MQSSSTAQPVASPQPASPTLADLPVYEASLAELLEMRHAVAFGYGRHALSTLLNAGGLRPTDEVVLSPLTCKVVVLAIIGLGLRPVYADIDPQSLNLDPRRVDRAVGKATRAVLFQHTYGNSGLVAEVAEIAASRALLLIEDRAQSTLRSVRQSGAEVHGQAAVFSHNLRKPIPAGSGGVAVTNDEDLARRVRWLRDALPPPSRRAEGTLRTEVWLHRHVLRPERYWFLYGLQRLRAGRKASSLAIEIDQEIYRTAVRPSSYQARAGLESLTGIEAVLAHRRLCCTEYRQALGQMGGIALPCAGSNAPLFYFPVLVSEKEKLLEAARRRRIELIAWPTSTPIYGVDRERDLPRYGYVPGTAPVAEEVARRLVGLPTDLHTQAAQRTALIDLIATHARAPGSGRTSTNHSNVPVD